MKDYAAKDFLHPRIALAEWVLGIAIIAVIVLGLGWLQQRDEDARLAELNRDSASSLCIPGPGEIATIAVVDNGYECAIKRGHQVVSMFEV